MVADRPITIRESNRPEKKDYEFFIKAIGATDEQITKQANQIINQCNDIIDACRVRIE